MSTATASEPSNRRWPLAAAVGIAVGLLPSPWGATPLALLLALRLRLNPLVVQAANYAVWPLQLALMPAFLLAGGRLCGASLPLQSLSAWRSLLHDPAHLTAELGRAQAGALLLWLLLAPLLIFTLPRLLQPLQHRFQARPNRHEA